MKTKTRVCIYSKYHGSSLVHLSECPILWSKGKKTLCSGEIASAPQCWFPKYITKITRKRPFYHPIRLSSPKLRIWK